MTKVSDTAPKGIPSTKTRKSRQTKAVISDKDKWNPNKPFHVTQEELWERIHEIERGPFISLEEGFTKFETWKQELLKSKL